MGSGGRTASVREAKAERRQGQPRDCVCVGPCHSPAAPTGQAVAGRTPSTLARQQDFPRAPLAQHKQAAGFHSCPPCSLRLGVWSAGAQGSFAAWVGGGKEGEAAFGRPGWELVVEQSPGCQRKTHGACSHALQPAVTLLFVTVSLQNGIPRAFRFLKLGIRSNWGKPGYTCIYRVQVHGKIVGRNAVSQTPASSFNKN